jgi:hypothetical protein
MLPDKLLINLRILSKIQKNGRITKSNEGIINLENDTLYKGIKRFIYNDSRKQSVFEINSIIDETSVTFQHLINSKYLNKSFQNTAEYVKRIEVINLLLKELHEAKNGVENLGFTYRNDQNIISQIDIVILKINRIIRDTVYQLENNGINEITLINITEDNGENEN